MTIRLSSVTNRYGDRNPHQSRLCENGHLFNDPDVDDGLARQTMTIKCLSPSNALYVIVMAEYVYMTDMTSFQLKVCDIEIF